MSQLKIIFTDIAGKVQIEVEGDIPQSDNISLMSNAQKMALATLEGLKMQEFLQSVATEKKDLTNDEEDDKTKYRN